MSRTDRKFRQRNRSRKLVAVLYEAQRGLCGHCGKRMAPPGDVCDDAMLATIDHVWPRARLGPDHDGNKMLMHRPCNGAKGDREPNGCEIIMHEAVKSILGVNLADAPIDTDRMRNPAPAVALQALRIAA